MSVKMNCLQRQRIRRIGGSLQTEFKALSLSPITIIVRCFDGKKTLSNLEPPTLITKKTFQIILLGAVDTHYNFFLVNVGARGSM